MKSYRVYFRRFGSDTIQRCIVDVEKPGNALRDARQEMINLGFAFDGRNRVVIHEVVPATASDIDVIRGDSPCESAYLCAE